MVSDLRRFAGDTQGVLPAHSFAGEIGMPEPQNQVGIFRVRKANWNQFSRPRWKRQFVFARRSLEMSIDGMATL